MLRIIDHETLVAGIGDHIGSKGTPVFFASLDVQHIVIAGQTQTEIGKAPSYLLQIRLQGGFGNVEFVRQIEEVDIFFGCQQFRQDDHHSFIGRKIGMFLIKVICVIIWIKTVLSAIGKDHLFFRCFVELSYVIAYHPFRDAQFFR